MLYLFVLGTFEFQAWKKLYNTLLNSLVLLPAAILMKNPDTKRFRLTLSSSQPFEKRLDFHVNLMLINNNHYPNNTSYDPINMKCHFSIY